MNWMIMRRHVCRKQRSIVPFQWGWCLASFLWVSMLPLSRTIRLVAMVVQFEMACLYCSQVSAWFQWYLSVDFIKDQSLLADLLQQRLATDSMWSVRIPHPLRTMQRRLPFCMQHIIQQLQRRHTRGRLLLSSFGGLVSLGVMCPTDVLLMLATIFWFWAPFICTEALLNWAWTRWDIVIYRTQRTHQKTLCTLTFDSEPLPMLGRVSYYKSVHRRPSGQLRWNLEFSRTCQGLRTETHRLQWSSDMMQCVIKHDDSQRQIGTSWTYQIPTAQPQGLFPHPTVSSMNFCHYAGAGLWFQFQATFDPQSRECSSLFFKSRLYRFRARCNARWIRALQRARARLLAPHLARVSLYLIPDLALIIARYAVPLHSQFAIAPTFLAQHQLCE